MESLEFIREALLLNKLKHLNIIKFHGVVLDNKQDLITNLIFEYMNVGDLLSYLKKQKVNYFINNK